ncbi:MAG: DnaJ domain-containing protein [Malacoplasma sp.]
MTFLIVIGIVIVILMVSIFFYKRKQKGSVANFPKKHELKIEFQQKDKQRINDPNLQKDFSILFEKIKNKSDVEKYNELVRWSNNKDIPIIYALCFYELKDENDQYPISLEWFIYILFIFNLWAKRNENIFDFKNNVYSLKGEFVFFEYDHDDDRKTADVYVLYYVYNKQFIFCGCYKNQNTLQIVSYIAKRIKVSEAEMKGNDWNFLISQILKIINEIYLRNKANANNNFNNNTSEERYENPLKNYLDGNHYKILNIKKDATKDEIKKAYRTQAKKYHPDVYKQSDANKRMIEINKAYEILMDDKLRAQYDNLIS